MEILREGGNTKAERKSGNAMQHQTKLRKRKEKVTGIGSIDSALDKVQYALCTYSQPYHVISRSWAAIVASGNGSGACLTKHQASSRASTL